MAKLGGLVRAATRSNLAVRMAGANHNHAFSAAVARESSRQFSTETQDAAVDSFLKTQSPDSFFGRLTGITKHTLKADIINLLEGCGLTMEDVKVDYNRMYYPTAMMVHFSSSRAYNLAIREITKKGRLYRLERVRKEQWDLISPYDGKTVILQGIPREAITADIERFLSGCEYEASSIQLVYRAVIAQKIATVRFPSQTQAMNCFITRNKGFCMNNQILVRVLQ